MIEQENEMRVKRFLEQVAYVAEVEIMPPEKSKVYQSKFDDSYITHVGMEKNVKFLADRVLRRLSSFQNRIASSSCASRLSPL